ncbi:hypothetical protein ACFU8W_44470 [Streptomyces sp. NPDC057565]|uniref:hypothetical protein n=1 Tax=Streptomyces sp. NPDC057565 TaxID=3346169 RepID=UPI0036B1DB99
MQRVVLAAKFGTILPHLDEWQRRLLMGRRPDRSEQYAVGLLWSAEPMPGWDSEKQPYTSFRSGKADSPGYTQEQAAQVRRFQAELLRLSTEVATHPHRRPPQHPNRHHRQRQPVLLQWQNA